MKRFLALLTLLFLLSGCAAVQKEPERKQYNATFLTLFDTVTTVVARSESEDYFRAAAQKVHDDLLVYHQLFDVYNSYEGITNLKDINDAAGVVYAVREGDEGYVYAVTPSIRTAVQKKLEDLVEK